MMPFTETDSKARVSALSKTLTLRAFSFDNVFRQTKISRTKMSGLSVLARVFLTAAFFLN